MYWNSTRPGQSTGRISSSNVYVDGLSVGDIGTVVLRDRQMLSRDGLCGDYRHRPANRQAGGRPDIVSRGFGRPQGYTEMLEKSRTWSSGGWTTAASIRPNGVLSTPK